MLDAGEPSGARKDWMSVLAKAPTDLLASRYAELGEEPEFDWLRAPEIGTVMVRGRAGGTGAPFNLGEMTVTRCSLQLGDGAIGHAYVPGRDRDHARMAAICDALLLGSRANEVRVEIIDPLRAAYEAKRAMTAGQAEKTRVDFFTMVRGEG
ncbi:MAG: phosphonate C-P lyase system protein PhnG [Pseudomonadota bacterium]